MGHGLRGSLSLQAREKKKKNVGKLETKIFKNYEDNVVRRIKEQISCAGLVNLKHV